VTGHWAGLRGHLIAREEHSLFGGPFAPPLLPTHSERREHLGEVGGEGLLEVERVS
jgi:hypothetical protein